MITRTRTVSLFPHAPSIISIASTRTSTGRFFLSWYTFIFNEAPGLVGNTVRVGIEAPRSLPVYREEIWHAVRAENRAAADAAPLELPTPNVA